MVLVALASQQVTTITIWHSNPGCGRTLSPAELEAGAVFRFTVNNRIVFNSFSRWRTRQRATWRHDPD